jgi:predicted RecA/RadA family phage recombinase
MSSIAKKAVEKYDGKVIPFYLLDDRVVGDVVPVGVSMVGIAVNSGLTGEKISLELEKTWTIKAKDSEAIAIGDVVYWDDTAKEMTKVDTDNIYAGRALSSKGTSAGTIDVKINV